MVPEFRKRKTELMEIGNFCLFAVKGKWKRQISPCLLQTETNGKWKFVFLDRQLIKGYPAIDKRLSTIAISASMPM
jgi:hypothetical protein